MQFRLATTVRVALAAIGMRNTTEDITSIGVRDFLPAGSTHSQRKGDTMLRLRFELYSSLAHTEAFFCSYLFGTPVSSCVKFDCKYEHAERIPKTARYRKTCISPVASIEYI